MLEPSVSASEASDYEQQRQRNIAACLAKRQELGLFSLGNQVSHRPAAVRLPRVKSAVLPGSPRRSNRVRLLNSKPDYREEQLVPERKLYKHYPNTSLTSTGPVTFTVTHAPPSMGTPNDSLQTLFNMEKATSCFVRSNQALVTAVIDFLVHEG